MTRTLNEGSIPFQLFLCWGKPAQIKEKARYCNVVWTISTQTECAVIRLFLACKSKLYLKLLICFKKRKTRYKNAPTWQFACRPKEECLQRWGTDALVLPPACWLTTQSAKYFWKHCSYFKKRMSFNSCSIWPQLSFVIFWTQYKRHDTKLL